MLPVVALVGRPNVGKSTLFNALTKSRDALVADLPGVTRDRHYGICRPEEQRPFLVVDTGGLTDESETLAELTVDQAKAAMDEAAIVVFVVDARDGLLPMDHQVLRHIRKLGKPSILAVNKMDGVNEDVALAEFSTLGLDTVVPMAASHRRGVSDLVDEIQARLPAEAGDEAAEDPERIKVAIIGRPNVGKSTLVNRLLGEERVIASEVPGTTRDAIHVPLERDGKKYVLIDTAGVRRRARVEDAVEKFSVIKTLQALERAHVAIVMLDASEGITDQDATVLGHALEAGRALVLAVNKWDNLDTYTRDRTRADLERKLTFVPYAMRIFISAKHGSNLAELMKAVVQSHRSATKKISSNQLTEAMGAATEAYQPPMYQGRAAKLRYAHLVGQSPPHVIVHGTRVSTLADSYKRYLENYFRKTFKLVGTPIKIDFRDGANPFEGKKNELTERQVKKRRRLMRHAKGR